MRAAGHRLQRDGEPLAQTDTRHLSHAHSQPSPAPLAVIMELASANRVDHDVNFMIARTWGADLEGGSGGGQATLTAAVSTSWSRDSGTRPSQHRRWSWSSRSRG